MFSPYGAKENFNYKLVLNTIEINAPVDSIFNFLGNSANAARWSVYVDHITTLNNDSVPDGTPGSRRRCFQNADEQGIKWDELITLRETNKKRQIIIYNDYGFPLMASHLATEQLYENIGENKTKLSFTLFFLNYEPSMLEQLKTYIAGFKVKSVYEKNMLNIKRIIEEKNG